MYESDTATLPEIVRVDPLKLRVLDARILIQMSSLNDKSEGGILLPPSAQQDKATAIAKVVRVGDGRVTEQGIKIPIRVKAGDHILMGKYAGTLVSAGSDYRIINEIEILAIIE